MNGEGRLLRLGEKIVASACQRLPNSVRDERYREWTAELPAILYDPHIRFPPLRAFRMLAYSADILRGSIFAPAGTARLTRGDAIFYSLLIAADLAFVAFNIWIIVSAPRHGLPYLQLAWSLILLAYPVSVIVRGARALATMVIVIGMCLVGAAVNLWAASLSPADWLNYLVAAVLLCTPLAMLLLQHRRARAGRA